MDGAPYSEPTTSREAAESIADDLNRLEGIVFGEIASRGEVGATPHEVAEACGLSVNTVRPRVTQMQQRGVIEYAGECRLTPSGRRSRAWRAVARQLSLADLCR